MDQGISTKVIDLGGSVTQCRNKADYIVVDDITKPGVRNELAMVLLGGCLLSSKCFTGGSELAPGTRIAFKSQLLQPKWIFISSDFKDIYPGITKVIERTIQLQSSPRRWRLLSYDDMIVRGSSSLKPCPCSSIANIRHWSWLWYPHLSHVSEAKRNSYAPGRFLCFVGDVNESDNVP